MTKFKITKDEFFLALAFAVMGFLLTTRLFLGFLDGLTALGGLVVYYVILYSSLSVLSRFGLVIYKFNIKTPLQVLGTILITFAFFTVIDWESPYTNIATGHQAIDVSPVLYQAEDGAVWYLWSLIGIESIELLRLLTYVLTPFMLTLAGALLISKQVHLE